MSLRIETPKEQRGPDPQEADILVRRGDIQAAHEPPALTPSSSPMAGIPICLPVKFIVLCVVHPHAVGRDLVLFTAASRVPSLVPDRQRVLKKHMLNEQMSE